MKRFYGFDDKNFFTILIFFTVTGILVMATIAWADSGSVTAKSRTIVTEIPGYAKVEPVVILKINAPLAGTLTGISVLAGNTIKAGTEVGQLAGPVIDALLAQRKAAVSQADASVNADQKLLALEQKNLESHLGTQKAVYQAEADLSASRAHLHNARSQLAAARESIILTSPVDGTVLSINAAEGELVREGSTILTIQPSGSLWLKAAFYGSDAKAVYVGMTGRFKPADGGNDIPVIVKSVIGPVGQDGSQAVGLFATIHAPGWRNGEPGMVILKGAERTLVSVPTRALILDKGKWWVLVHTNKGNKRQEVVPGPNRDESTLIEKGLDPGAEVVVENAYLKFHLDFSSHYQPPD